MSSRKRNDTGTSIAPDASSTSSIVERLLDLTKCQICKNILEEPRFLPCHHTFCTKCIQRLMNSGSEEFLCPVDRHSIKIPKFGVTAFQADMRTLQLDALRSQLEDSLFFMETQDECDSSMANIDVNLEWISKGIKDIKHSSAIAQHRVHTMFENIYKTLKQKEEEFIEEIQKKCADQIGYMEYEKYRLIDIKRYQNDVFTSYDAKTVNTDDELDSKSIGKVIEAKRNSETKQIDRDALNLSIASCHIGHQHIEFIPCDHKVKELKSHMENLGKISWEFDLKINLDRSLFELDEYPSGVEIKGTNQELVSPTGITKGWSNRLLVANKEKNEIIVLDNSFNVISNIKGKGKFQSVNDIATSDNGIYIADANGAQVILMNKKGDVIKSFGKQNSDDTELFRPNGVAIDSRGRVLVTDSLNHCVKILSYNLQKCVTTIKGKQNKDDLVTNFNYPSGITVDTEDNIYVCDTNNKRVVILTKEGKFIQEIKTSGISDPKSIAVTTDEKLLITDRENSRLIICDMKGKQVRHVSGITNSNDKVIKFHQIHGVVVEGTDKIMVTDTELNSAFLF